MKGFAFGIDIGGTNTKIGLISTEGEIKSFQSFPTRDPGAFKCFIDKTKSTCDLMLKAEKLGWDQIAGIGVGAPNGNFKTGRIESPPNLKQWGSVDLVLPFKKVFKLDVSLDNDANIAALGEGRWGGAKSMKDYIVVTLGTGIGTGVVANGELVRGGNGLAGEGGHIIIHPNGRLCGCGGKGHFEMYGSAGGIETTVKELTGQELSFKEISLLYQKGDQAIGDSISQSAKDIGRGIAAMASLMAPEAFILAGGVATLGEGFRAQIEVFANEFVYRPFSGQVKVLKSQISTGEGAVLGAAGLVF